MSREAYLHAHSEGAPGAPLVFTFHGTGGNELQFHDLARQMVPGAHVVSPRGDVSEMGAARFFRRTGEGVYDMDDLAARTAKMAIFVQAWKAENPDAEVYGFGYSNGANILASLAIEHPELFDRVGLLHPLIPWQPAPNAALKDTIFLITAGRNDPICPWPLTESLVTWATEQGAQVATEFHAGGHEIRTNEVAALENLLKP